VEIVGKSCSFTDLERYWEPLDFELPRVDKTGEKHGAAGSTSPRLAPDISVGDAASVAGWLPTQALCVVLLRV